MKNIKVLTVSLLTLATVVAYGRNASADATVEPQPNTSQSTVYNPGIVILDQGIFDSPILLDQYNHDLNQVNFDTGKIVFDYSSKSLITIAIGETKHFNLKLPEEFNRISGLNEGSNLKSAITASYKLPGESDFRPFTPEDITTSYEGQVDFKLSAKHIINAGQTTKIKVSINYGKILDSLNLGADYDYHNIIANAVSGAYEFKGVLTNDDCIDIFPDSSAIGVTSGNSATQ